MSDFRKLRPKPEDEALQEIWEHVTMRVAVLTGNWSQYADERLADFFAPEVLEFLPPAEVSHNPALTINLQLSTLYDDPPVVEAEGTTDEELEVLVPPELWAQSQELLQLVVGTNDVLVLTGFTEGRGLWHKVVPLNSIVMSPNPQMPDQPNYVRHLEASIRPNTSPPLKEWTWTTYDLRDPANPVFKVEVEGEGHSPGDALEDVTEIYAPGLGGRYIYTDAAGAPIWTWTAYHRRVSNALMRPWAGSEVFNGTLTGAALKTYWVAGVRDGAHPQRWTLDAEPVMAGNTSMTDGKAKGVKVVRMNQMGVLQWRSVGTDKSGSLGQFAPAMDPKSAGEAIAAYSAELAVYAGVAPQDISISGGSTGMSGYAIALSRDGQRKARKALEVPMMRGDKMRLATSATLLNALTGTSLPEDPEDYRIIYADLNLSLDEVKASLEEAKVMREQGVLGQVDQFLRFNPGMTREEAIARIIKNAQEEAEIQRQIAEAVPALPVDESPGDDAESQE